MKSSLLYFFVALFLIFSGCSSESNSENDINNDSEIRTREDIISEESKQPDSSNMKNIEMTLEPKSFSADNMRMATLTIRNNSGRKMIFGERYYIERNENGSWTAADALGEVAFNDIGYEINETGTEVLEVLLKNESYTYEPGNYRLCKEFRAGSSTSTACTEFTVE
jgi:hypothetical protein